MNKKTKIMYIVQPGFLGSGAILFSAYEFNHNSEPEEDLPPLAEAKPVIARSTQEKRSWTHTVVRLPETFRRTVWQPLARRVQKLGQAA